MLVRRLLDECPEYWKYMFTAVEVRDGLLQVSVARSRIT